MEIRIRDTDVLLTTHKTYCEADEVNGLQAVSQYAPFQKYVAECEARGPAPRAFIIRNIFRFAHRVVGVVADVEYVDAAGNKLSQTINLTDQKPAVMLPIIELDVNKKYAVVVHHRRLATGLQATTEAITGVIGPDGQFCSDHDEAMKEAGFDLSEVTVLPRTYTIGGEGSLAYTFFTTSIKRTEEIQFAKMLDKGDGMQPRLIAVPIKEVNSLGDAKASLAACLLAYYAS